MRKFLRDTRSRLRRLLHLVLSSHHTERQVAAGAAMGIFIGFTPLLGLQMIIAAVFATFFKLSRIAAVTMVYITNPLTAAFIYGACYLLGIFMLWPFGFRVLSLDRVMGIFKPSEELDLWDSAWELVGRLLNLGWEGLAPLWLGCLVCGAVGATITYHVTLRFVRAQRLLRTQRMARRAKRRIERVRMEQAREHGDDTP